MTQTPLSDIAPVSARWLFLRDLRALVVVLVVFWVFVDRYGVPTIGERYRVRESLSDRDYGAVIRFRRLHHTAPVAAVSWALRGEEDDE